MAAADAAYWMRLYFRHARVISRALDHEIGMLRLQPRPPSRGFAGQGARAVRFCD